MIRKFLVLISVLIILAVESSISVFAKFEVTGRYPFLTKFDCATKIGFDNPPAGTLIWVKNKDNNLTAGLQKWDTGKMGGPSSGVILDVMPEVFTQALGGKTIDGFL
ncbi:hypothetical protein [Paenibacillus sp. RC84]|uniref:hypothetical protein n=1 Tax=Paenibacillus sp. RC84 TaxID=3156252 RepID=UPI003512BB21